MITFPINRITTDVVRHDDTFYNLVGIFKNQTDAVLSQKVKKYIFANGLVAMLIVYNHNENNSTISYITTFLVGLCGFALLGDIIVRNSIRNRLRAISSDRQALLHQIEGDAQPTAEQMQKLTALSGRLQSLAREIFPQSRTQG